MNRPEKRNSMIPEFWSELPTIIKEIDGSSKARVIVISSKGPHFTSGLDTSLFDTLNLSNTTNEYENEIQAQTIFYRKVKKLQNSFNSLEECRIPVIVAVQGGCIGAGLDLITACDLRFSTQDAFFTLFETNLALTADVGTFPRLAKIIPEGFVKQMAYTGSRIDAHEALRFGLINQIFSTTDNMLKSVFKTAREIAQKSPLAVHGCKTVINYSRDHSTQDTLDYVALWNSANFKIKEVKEALNAAKEKRSGSFVDLPKL